MSDQGAQNMANKQKPKKVRKLFSPQEDALLTQIMFQQPFETWIAVAEKLPGRTARQCRDRWVNYLSPSNKNGPWSHEEDQLLAEKYMEYGAQWTTIAKFFDGRSENNVKNRWYTYVKNRFNQGQPQPLPKARPVTVQKAQTSTHIKSSFTPAPIRVAPIKPQMPPQKTLLPPISTLDYGMPVQVINPIPAQFPQTQRFRSESVRPPAFYPTFNM